MGRRDPSQNFHHPWLKSQGVVMVVGDEFQSQPFLTIQYTNVQRLEVLRSCELPANQSVHTQSGCKKWVWAKPNFYPLTTRKQVVVRILEPIHQSQPCLTIHYTYNERLERSSWYEMADSVYIYSFLVWNVGTYQPKFSPPSTQKLWCGDDCGGWIPISTMSNHLIY